MNWIEAETLTSEFDAQEAAHDYAHEGWYFRIKRLSERQWVVLVRWGRVNKPSCCRLEKRTYVGEDLHPAYEPPKRTNRRLIYHRRKYLMKVA